MTVGDGRDGGDWNTAQRRAITVRDAATCRYPGCSHTICDVHHVGAWTDGGATDIDNGILLCTRHHTLIHAGFTTTGDANHQRNFHRPDGTPIATTRPPGPTPHLAA
jgi:hypothetical protein